MVGGQGDDEPLVAQKNALDRWIVEGDASEADVDATLFERGDLLQRHFEQDQLDMRARCAITANDVRQFGVES
jgi:hypothetical protein